MERVAETLSGQAGLLVELVSASIQPDLEKAGLSLSSFELLSAVQASGKKTSQIAIARRLGISAPSLSEAVQTAVKKGWLSQTPSSRDARVKEIALTPKGRRSVDKVLAAVRQVEAEIRTAFEAEEVEQTLDMLRRINGNLARNLQSRT